MYFDKFLSIGCHPLLRGVSGEQSMFYCVRWLVGQLIVPSNLGLSGTGQISFSHRCRRAVCVCDIYYVRVWWLTVYGGVMCVRFTVEPRHDEDYGTMEVALSVFGSLFVSELKNNNKEIQRAGAG